MAPRYNMNRPALIPNVTPILNVSRIFRMCVNLVLDTLKIYNFTSFEWSYTSIEVCTYHEIILVIQYKLIL